MEQSPPLRNENGVCRIDQNGLAQIRNGSGNHTIDAQCALAAKHILSIMRALGIDQLMFLCLNVTNFALIFTRAMIILDHKEPSKKDHAVLKALRQCPTNFGVDERETC